MNSIGRIMCWLKKQEPLSAGAGSGAVENSTTPYYSNTTCRKLKYHFW